MEQLRIWEADCALFDAVLALSFDRQELLNCCQSGGIELKGCGCRPPAQRVVSAVHRACHAATDFARLIERRLNLVHRDALRELADGGLEAFGLVLLGRELGEIPQLAGRLWALTTCPEPAAVHLRTHVQARLTLAGARAIAGAAGSLP